MALIKTLEVLLKKRLEDSFLAVTELGIHPWVEHLGSHQKVGNTLADQLIPNIFWRPAPVDQTAKKLRAGNRFPVYVVNPVSVE